MLAALETSSCLVEVDAEWLGARTNYEEQVPSTGQTDLSPSRGENIGVKIPAEYKAKGVGHSVVQPLFLCQYDSRDDN